jgi:hypothetical protein
MRYTISTLAAALIGLGVTCTNANAQAVYPNPSQDPNVQLVDSWYRHYLGRPVDQTGLQTWLPQLAAGNPQAGILGSIEYYNRQGGTPQGFITGLYGDVLSRQPDANEVQGWVFRLQQMGGDRIALSDEFLRSAVAELNTRAAPGFQAVAPQIVTQPVIVRYAQPAYVYGSTWLGRGIRSHYFVGNNRSGRHYDARHGHR